MLLDDFKKKSKNYLHFDELLKSLNFTSVLQSLYEKIDDLMQLFSQENFPLHCQPVLSTSFD